MIKCPSKRVRLKSDEKDDIQYIGLKVLSYSNQDLLSVHVSRYIRDEDDLRDDSPFLQILHPVPNVFLCSFTLDEVDNADGLG